MKHVSKFHLALSHHPSPSRQIVEFWLVFGLKMLEFLEGAHAVTRRTCQLLTRKAHIGIEPGTFLLLSCFCPACQRHSSENQSHLKCLQG